MIFTSQTLKIVLLNALEQLITNLENIKYKHKSTNKYFSDHEAPMLSTMVPLKTITLLNERIQNLTATEADLFFKFEEVLISAGSDQYFTTSDLLNAYYKLCDACNLMCSKLSLTNEAITGVIPENSCSVNYVRIEKISEASFRVDFLNKITSEYKNLQESVVFIDCMNKLWTMIAREERQPTPEEFLALQLAYYVLTTDPRSSLVLGLRYKPIGQPGFGTHAQTFMALTDPGEGHLFGTTRKLRWLQDAYVHMEHLERPLNMSRSEIEPYRVPSLTNFIKVRLHTGTMAPNTFYIGRIFHDSGNFDQDLLKVVRILSCAVNNVFSIGSAECKLTMDNMTTYEAVKFMRMIKAEVVKNDDQVLSAAWNLNSELVDDLECGGEICRREKGHVYTDRFEIAKVAIAITSMGGFEKLTWDGSSDSYPSKCIVPYQLSLAQLLTLVHLAHSLGLLTYTSAGFKLDEIKLAVLSGVDGVGIGGAQILRHMDEKTGYHGPYLEEHIDGILQKRNEATDCLYGRAVKLLCKLDTMFYEGSLSFDESVLRETLFNELLARYEKFSNESSIREYENLVYETNKPVAYILRSLESIEKMQISVNESKGMAKAKRLLRIKNAILSECVSMDESTSMWKYEEGRTKSCTQTLIKTLHNEDEDEEDVWREFKANLKDMIQTKDKAIETFYDQYPWRNLFNLHKQKVIDTVMSSLSVKGNSKKYHYSNLIRGKLA